MKTRITAAILFALCLAGQAQAQITKQGNLYQFRLKLVKGQTLNFGSSSTVNGASPSGQPIVAQIPFSMHITSVAKGLATVTASMGPISVGGRMVQNVQTVEVTVDSKGRTAGGGSSSLQGLTVQLPDKPIKVGGTWTASTSTGTGAGSQMVKATYTFHGITKVNGKQVADIGMRLLGTGQGAGNILISVDDGWLYRSQFKMVTRMNDPKGKQGVSISMSSTVFRLNGRK